MREDFQTYLLFIKVRTDIRTEVGSLREIEFPRGWYIYVGSAKRNLKSRLLRHFSADKKIYWHIDYLLNNREVRLKKYLLSEKEECEVANVIESSINTEGIIDFGCSDCKQCKSHLFYIKS